LFPTVYLLYSPTDGHALNFSFSNRISRPSQNMVNPFPFYQNKYTYACGREDLKPSYTYNAELGYTLKNNFNVSAYYSYSDDVFFQVVDLDAETNVTSFSGRISCRRMLSGLTIRTLSVPNGCKLTPSME